MALSKSQIHRSRHPGFGITTLGNAGLIVHGEKELRKLLDQMPKSMYTIIRRASARSMGPVVETAKRLAENSMDSGLLQESIGTKTKSYTRRGVVITMVGPRRGFKRKVQVTRRLGNTVFTYEEYRNPMNYAHLVEFGTQPHDLGAGSSIRRGVATGGRHHPGSRPKPFLRPALDNNKWRVLALFREETLRGMKKWLARRVAKGKAA